MMHSLKAQLLVSHLSMVLLMVCVMVWAAGNFLRLGHSIDSILRNNYDSVIAAQNMKEALEREDSAATFYLAGQADKARVQYQANWPIFQRWSEVEAHNITEAGEQQMSNGIQHQFPRYRRAVGRLLYARPALSPVQARAYYFSVLEPAFVDLKKRAQEVLDVNQSAIVRADMRAKFEAQQASRTGLGVTALALLLTLFFAGRSLRIILTPLRTFARQAEEIGLGNLNQRVELNHTAEIDVLATAFNQMTDKLQDAQRVEAERLHRAERMSDAALESLYDPVIVTDAAACIVHFNKAAEGLYGPAKQNVGRRVDQALGEGRIARAVDRAIHQEHVSAGEDEAALVGLHVAGSQRTYRLRATPMRDEETLLGAVAVLEDVTHLYELDRLKTEFIGVAAHELRTPVTSLLLSVQLMQEGAVGELTLEQRKVVAAQREDLGRLDRMMHDLLDMTRLEAGATPVRFELVSVQELICLAMQSVTAQAEAQNISLCEELANPMPQVRADRAKIERVLVNLLNNALRHTPKGGRITIQACPTDAGVKFAVADTGTGIAPEYLPHIFERFVQVPGATRGGAGLGLSIAQTVIRAHGGHLTVASKLGQGSTFTFTLSSDTLPSDTFPSEHAAPDQKEEARNDANTCN